MELTDYCSGLHCELAGWKSKMDDVIKGFDSMASGDKEKAVPHIRDLHILAEELTDRIDRLHRDCENQWKPNKIDLESRVTKMKTDWEGVWQNVSPGDFGG